MPDATVTVIPTMVATTKVCTLSEHLLCDGCDQPSPSVHAPSDDLVADAREAAEAAGWRCDSAADRDWCPSCIAAGAHLKSGDSDA